MNPLLCVVVVGNGRHSLACFIIASHQLLIKRQGTINNMAILVELLLRAVSNMEGSLDSRHISLATSDYPGHRCWVRPSLSQQKESIDSPRLPGTPIWLAAVYTSSFASVNKYWIPAMW